MANREKWPKWAIAEGVFRAAHNVPMKLAGALAQSAVFSMLLTFVIGIVVMIGGLVGAKVRRKPIWASKKQILGSLTFGGLGVISMVLGNEKFRLGAELGAATFLLTVVGLVTGALIDGFVFKKHLNSRQWLGLGVAGLAGYSVLGWPSLAALLEMPAWVVISMIIGLLVGINQGVTQLICEIDPFVKTFWVGLVYATAALVAIFVMDVSVFALAPGKFWGFGALVGACLVGVFTCNVKSYQDGAPYISIKKVLMNGTWLVTAFIVGAIFFSEQISVAKVLGIVLYPLAYVLVNSAAWQLLLKRLHINK